MAFRHYFLEARMRAGILTKRYQVHRLQPKGILEMFRSESGSVQRMTPRRYHIEESREYCFIERQPSMFWVILGKVVK